MAALRDEAEALAIALTIGAVDVDEVIEWADAHIAALIAPHWALCEVATSRGQYPIDVAARLRELPGRADLAVSRRLVIALTARKLARDPSRANQFAVALYHMALAGEIDAPELERLAWWAWDALDLAASGMIEETPDQIVASMTEALDQALAEAPPQWSEHWTPH